MVQKNVKRGNVNDRTAQALSYVWDTHTPE